jgi:peptidoglycan hydrolase-like protein with peptidoglycan-binding domain
MRALILAVAVLGFLASPNATKAGPSSTPRELASLDTTAVSDEATLENEDQIGLTKKTRRVVQRRLIRLGFHTKVNGKFEVSTRRAIALWQEERGYPKSGFINTAQHTALLEESGPAREDHRRHGGRAHRRRGFGGPIGAIGGAIGGLFRR